MPSTCEPSPTHTYSTAATFSEVSSKLLSTVGSDIVCNTVNSNRSVTPQPKPKDQQKRIVGKYEVDGKEGQRKVEKAQKELVMEKMMIDRGQ